MPCVHEGRTGSRSRVTAYSGTIWFTDDGSIVDEEVVDGSGDPLGDLVFGRGGIEDAEPSGLVDRHREEAVPDPPVEGDIEAGLEPGPIVRRLAGEPDLDRQVQQERQVRLEAAGRDLLERLE